MNQFNNESLRFQDKIVSVDIPETIKDIQTAIESIIDVYHALYGVVVFIFGKSRYQFKLNTLVTDKTIHTAEQFQTQEDINDNLVILPFPHE